MLSVSYLTTLSWCHSIETRAEEDKYFTGNSDVLTYVTVRVASNGLQDRWNGLTDHPTGDISSWNIPSRYI